MSNIGWEKTHELVVWVLLLGDELSLNTGKRKWNYVKWDKPTIWKGERFSKIRYIKKCAQNTNIYKSTFDGVRTRKIFTRLYCLFDRCTSNTPFKENVSDNNSVFTSLFLWVSPQNTFQVFLLCMSSINDLTENKDRCGQ